VNSVDFIAAFNLILERLDRIAEAIERIAKAAEADIEDQRKA